jgi:parvulin-like peptidyl-prolyl isomerase
MKKFTACSLVTGLAVQLSFAISALAAPAGGGEAARVNDHVITVDQVTARVVEQAHAGQIVSRKQALEDLIRKDVAVDEAKRLKIDQDPVVQDRINGVLFTSLLEKRVDPEFNRSTLSDAEAKAWYQKNPEIRTSQIFVALSPDASADEEQRATAKLNQAMADIKSGKMSFAEAAQKFSEDPTSTLGGDMDYRGKDRLDPSYYRAALKIGKIGDTIGPVRTAFGLNLIRLTGKHTWSESNRILNKKVIMEERRVELANRYLNDLRQKAKVTISEK